MTESQQLFYVAAEKLAILRVVRFAMAIIAFRWGRDLNKLPSFAAVLEEARVTLGLRGIGIPARYELFDAVRMGTAENASRHDHYPVAAVMAWDASLTEQLWIRQQDWMNLLSKLQASSATTPGQMDAARSPSVRSCCASAIC